MKIHVAMMSKKTNIHFQELQREVYVIKIHCLIQEIFVFEEFTHFCFKCQQKTFDKKKNCKLHNL